jgi:hypothetical protein
MIAIRAWGVLVAISFVVSLFYFVATSDTI